MMDERESGPHTSPTEGRLFGAVRRMLATAVAVVHTRAELLATELQEEVQRAASILLWSIVALFFASLTVLMIALTVLIVFWDTHRVLTAVLISAVFVVIAISAALYARSVVRAKPKFLSGTLNELKRDRAMLEGDS
jgi:uncharacterized membrane protein YqjE